ncbi:MAG: CoA transferase, partial [bacterium]|nr:CoA transferase [bacterium]
MPDSPTVQPGAGALSDLRVVEFAQALAIPYCGKLLSDLGADVVKVEPPRGDTYRLQNRSRVKHEGRDFAINNRGKRSLCLDLTNPESREVIAALVRDADVVLVSLKGSDVPRYGLDYETLRAINPRLVYLENSPYGSQ